MLGIGRIPRCVGDLTGEDRRRLVRKDRDSGVAGAAGVLADNSATRCRGRDRAAVGGAEGSIRLVQSRAGRSDRRPSRSGRDGGSG